jgi:hypothetical protein
MKPWYLNPVVKHIAAWLLWFGLNSMGIFIHPKPFGDIFWLWLVVNIVVLVSTYYVLFFLLFHLYRRTNYGLFYAVGMWAKIRHHFRLQVLGVLVLAAGYIVFMLWLDRATGYDKQPDFTRYPIRRFEEMGLCIIAAGIFAFLKGFRQWLDRHEPPPPPGGSSGKPTQTPTPRPRAERAHSSV